MRPLTILFTYHDRCDVAEIHYALLAHHNPGVPIVPLVCNGSARRLHGTVDLGRIDDVMFNVDRMPAFWWSEHHAYKPWVAERCIVIESDCLVTTCIGSTFQPAWSADVAAAKIATPATDPDWEWWPSVDRIPLWARAGVMPSGVVMYSRTALDILARSSLACMAEVRIGTAARLAGLTLEAVPGLSKTVHCRPELIRLDSKPGVYHPVKVRGGPNGECIAAHEFGESLLEGKRP
jgi:hypothetical protein